MNVSLEPGPELTFGVIVAISAGDSREAAITPVQLRSLRVPMLRPNSAHAPEDSQSVTAQQEAKRRSVCACNKRGDLLID